MGIDCLAGRSCYYHWGRRAPSRCFSSSRRVNAPFTGSPALPSPPASARHSQPAFHPLRAWHALCHRPPDSGTSICRGEKDGERYITAGVLVARHPETGVRNLSIHRLQVSGPSRLGILILPRHLWHFFQAAERAGKPLEVAIAIGVDPITALASQALTPPGVDELEIASALRGEPLDLVGCETVGLEVPAHAEIVVEGLLLPHVREPEGPFGEYPRYYGPREPRPVVEVTAVTHRYNRIYHTIVPASREHLLLGAIPREAALFQMVEQVVPTVRAAHLTPGGSCRYHAVVSIEKRHEGEGKNAILAALASSHEVKHVVVVDSDIDVFDLEEVEWAVAMRCQADRDVVIVPGGWPRSLIRPLLAAWGPRWVSMPPGPWTRRRTGSSAFASPGTNSCAWRTISTSKAFWCSGARVMLADKRARLREILSGLPAALVAFSGGVDSTFLLHECRQVLGERVLAVTASSPIHPPEEVERARWLAREMGVAHLVLATSELDLPGFSSNPPDRCCLCKRALLGLLWEVARSRGMGCVVEGSNASDLGEYRPGRRAVTEVGARSPLLEAGLTKGEIRELSRQAGLPTWDLPTMAC